MTLVDPFIPTRPQKKLAKPPSRPELTDKPPAGTAVKTARRPHVEQFVPSTNVRITALPKATPPVATPTPATVPMLPKKTFTAPTRQRSRFKSGLQLTVITIWALALGFGIYSQTAGEAAIAGYAIVALWLRLSSRTSFALALCAFGAIMVTEIISPDSTMITNFAIYAFLLLVVGSLTLGLESRQQTKWAKWHRQQGKKVRRK